MIVELKTIQGWKWTTLEEVADAEASCQAFFDLPMGVNDITTGCLGVMPNYNISGGIDFYYVGYVYPSQLSSVPALGEPQTFDITIIHD